MRSWWRCRSEVFHRRALRRLYVEGGRMPLQGQPGVFARNSCAFTRKCFRRAPLHETALGDLHPLLPRQGAPRRREGACTCPRVSRGSEFFVSEHSKMMQAHALSFLSLARAARRLFVEEMTRSPQYARSPAGSAMDVPRGRKSQLPLIHSTPFSSPPHDYARCVAVVAQGQPPRLRAPRTGAR